MKKFIYVVTIILAIGSAGLFFYNRQKSVLLKKIEELIREDKDAIIETALKMELPVPDSIVIEHANKISELATQKVHESEYERAIKIVFEGLKKYPKNFMLQADLASLLGDCSEITPEPLKDRMVKKAKQMFDELMKEVEGQPKETYYDFKNEYYFRFALYREQYELGVQRILDYWETPEMMTTGYRGYYCQGVGASRYAKKLIEEGNKQLALDYAQKAIVAWAQYFSYRNDYYNAYVHYALALGILGYKDEMMRALKRSASIIKRDLDYFEFKEIIGFIDGLEHK